MKAELIPNTPDIALTLTIDEAKALYWAIDLNTIEGQPLPDELKARFTDMALDVEATVYEALEDAGVYPDDDLEPDPEDPDAVGVVIAIDIPDLFNPSLISRAIRDELARTNRALGHPA